MKTTDNVNANLTGRISVIVPAKNEADCLPEMLAELPRDLLHEIIVVDGHSTDGTPALQASLGAPRGVEVSADGNTVYVSDTENFKIHCVGPDGLLRTIAGSDDGGDSGDGGPATSATLNHPYSLRLYGDDVLLISDFCNNKLRAVKLK